MFLRSFFGKASTRAEESTYLDAKPISAPAHLPVPMEQFSKEWMQMTGQDNFDGFRLEAGKVLSKSLQVSHSLILGTSLRESGYIYQFGPTLQTMDGKTFLTARAGIDGSLNGRFGTKISDAVDAKVTLSSSLKDAQRHAPEAELCYSGKHSHTMLKTVHQGTWILNGSHSQEITDNLWLGTELTYIPLNGVSITSFGARFVDGPHVFSMNVGQQPNFRGKSPNECLSSIKAQYIKKVSDRLSVGVELEGSVPDMESGLRAGYEFSFKQARVQGMLDTAGRVSCCVSDMMGFGVSGMIDYVRNEYKFGFMMHIVPQPEISA